MLGMPVLPPLGVRTADTVLASQVAGLFEHGALLRLPLTSQYFVDANRSDTYGQDGNFLTPFKTLAAAYAAAKIGATSLNPKYINLLSSITEDLTMDTGYVGIRGFTTSGVRAPLYINGTITIAPTGGAINDNSFSLANLALYRPNNGNCVNVLGGANPMRVFLESVWFQNGGAGSFGLVIDNTGAGTTVGGQLSQFTPNATGGGINVVNGICNLVTCNSTGGSASCVSMFNVSGLGVLNFENCQLRGTAQQLINCEAGAYNRNNLTITQTLLTNSLSTGHGVTLGAGSFATLANCGFDILTGVGAKAVNGVASANTVTVPFSLVNYNNVSFTNVPGLSVKNTTVTSNKAQLSVLSGVTPTS